MPTNLFDALFEFFIDNNLMTASQITREIKRDTINISNNSTLENISKAREIIDENPILFVIAFLDKLQTTGGQYNADGWNFSNIKIPENCIQQTKNRCNKIMQLGLTTAFDPTRAIIGILKILKDTNPENIRTNQQ